MQICFISRSFNSVHFQLIHTLLCCADSLVSILLASANDNFVAAS